MDQETSKGLWRIEAPTPLYQIFPSLISMYDSRSRSMLRVCHGSFPREHPNYFHLDTFGDIMHWYFAYNEDFCAIVQAIW